MDRSKNDIFNRNLLDLAEKKIDKYTEIVVEEITKKLRKKYVGKKVKCKCFDAWTEGDDYWFDEKLIDIRACVKENNKFYIVVTFKYKSLFANENDLPKDTTFYLESIERVE